MLLAQSVGYVAKEPRAIERHHLNTSAEHGLTVIAGPFDVDETRGLIAHQRHSVCTVGSVHADAATAGDEAHDLVAGHWGAASRETNQDIVEALDMNPSRRSSTPKTAWTHDLR